MKEIFDFLNAQNGDRLFGYALVLIILTTIIVSGITSIVNSITSTIKRKQNKIKDKNIN